MPYKVIFDPGLCQGYANCIIEAPEIWDFDEDRNIAVLRQEQPEAGTRAKAEAAARGCPARAILVEDVAS